MYPVETVRPETQKALILNTKNRKGWVSMLEEL